MNTFVVINNLNSSWSNQFMFLSALYTLPQLCSSGKYFYLTQVVMTASVLYMNGLKTQYKLKISFIAWSCLGRKDLTGATF